MAHHHHHHSPGSRRPTSREEIAAHRRLTAILAPFALITIIGLIALWPRGDAPAQVQGQPAGEQLDATITGVEQEGCEPPPGATQFEGCALVEIRLDEGPDEGQTFTLQFLEGSGRDPQPGDPVVVAPVPGATEQQYSFIDYRRGTPLLVLGLAFVAVVVGLSRFYGLASLIGLGLSLLILVLFVLPAILEGKSPLIIAIIGSSAVMFLTLYLAHGFNPRTSTAILGTLSSLVVTVALAGLFVELCRFTGFGSEEATFLQISAQQVNLEGLLLGGIVIGTLGVLDDVTVTQASAVWELHVANPSLSRRQLYAAGLRIGRDHIASTVNTLVLAYAGASLPLLVLFTLSSRSLGSILNSEVVAEEVVRTLVGSIGLVASVPITTALAARVVGAPAGASDEEHAKEDTAPAADPHDRWSRDMDRDFWDE